MDDCHLPADVLAHPPAACQPLQGALLIPINLLTPSPLNPRKRWTPERVARMVASLKTSGQVQPIRVRPNPLYRPGNGRPTYEIVVGETRWRAAPEAGLGMLDAVVGDYTDQQVIELGVVENTDRNDLHPLEEADAYHALLREADGLQGYASVQDLAARFGQSASYVYQRLKLRNLCPAGREAFLADKIKASVALLIARMPDLAEQAKATATLAAGWGGEAYSYRNAAELLQRDYMLALGKATFDILADYGVAGPCHACTKRSGAAPDLFADVTSGDMCQDSRCYQAKTEEARQAKLAADAAAAAAAPAPAASPVAPAPTKSDGLAQAEPKKAAPREPAVAPKPGGGGELDRAKQQAKAEEALTRKRFVGMLFGALVAAVNRRLDYNLDALRPAALQAYDGLSYEAAEALYDALDWSLPAVGTGGLDADFRKRLDTIAGNQLVRLLILISAAEALSGDRQTVELLEDKHDEVVQLLSDHDLSPQRWWERAGIAARNQLEIEAVKQADQAAGAARRKLSPTDAFVAQHGNAATAAPASAPTPAPTTPAVKTRAKPAVKYRNPMTGETWTGRGLMPKWLKVRMAEGHKLDEYVTGATASAAPTTEARDAGVDQSDEGDTDAAA